MTTNKKEVLTTNTISLDYQQKGTIDYKQNETTDYQQKDHFI